METVQREIPHMASIELTASKYLLVEMTIALLKTDGVEEYGDTTFELRVLGHGFQ